MSLVYDVTTVCTIRELIERSAEEYPENDAFIVKEKNSDHRHLTYASLLESVRQYAVYLNSLGLENKKIAVIGKNSYEWALSYLAVTCGVGIIVPIDKELKSPEVNNVLTMSDAAAIIYSPDVENTVAACAHSCIRLSTEQIHSFLEAGKELIENGCGSYETHVIDPYALGSLIYTSGTTGVAKGVMLSQYNICSDIVGTLKHVHVTPEDRSLSVLPLHHTYECTLGFLAMLYCGASICYASSLLRVVSEFKEYKPTIFFAVPQLVKAMHNGIIKKVSEIKGGKAFLNVGKTITTLSGKFAPAVAPHIFKSIHDAFGGRLKTILVGAAALDPAIFRDFERFGFKMYNGYGLTETSPLFILHYDNMVRKSDTVGLPMSGTKVKLVDVNEEGVGEIAVKGPMVMLGYYNDEKRTREVFDSDGYFHTGDLACIDSETKQYKIVGRTKNMIVTDNGKKIFPEEIEYLLEPCPSVKECVAYGEVTDEGSTVVAVKIFPNFEELEKQGISKDSPDSEKLMQDYFLQIIKEKVNRRLPGYKAVRKVSIRFTEFEKTTTQKIKRNL